MVTPSVTLGEGVNCSLAEGGTENNFSGGVMDKGKLKGIREFILLRSRFLSIQRFDLSISSAKKIM